MIEGGTPPEWAMEPKKPAWADETVQPTVNVTPQQEQASPPERYIGAPKLVSDHEVAIGKFFKQEIILGRAAPNTQREGGAFIGIQFSPDRVDSKVDKNVSRNHAKVHIGEKFLFIKDEGSNHGTEVVTNNGSRLKVGSQYMAMEGGETIILGGTTQIIVQKNEEAGYSLVLLEKADSLTMTDPK